MANPFRIPTEDISEVAEELESHAHLGPKLVAPLFGSVELRVV